jgi:hypothetical protein
MQFAVTGTTQPQASLLHLGLAVLALKGFAPMIFPRDQVVKGQWLVALTDIAALPS